MAILITDNAVYSVNERTLTSDYQEIDPTIPPKPTTTLVKSDNHCSGELENTYEATSSTEASYYAEVGPLQDVVSVFICCTLLFCAL